MPAEARARRIDSESAGPGFAADGFALGVSSSFRGRAWRMRCSADDARALELAGLAPTLARVLAGRGVTPQNAGTFLDPRLRNLLPDPRGLAHMERAAGRFARAVMAGETIAILGDYDVDGACSAALLLNYLKRVTPARVLLHVPDRLTEGYGPSLAAVTSLASQGATLLVTVDCGAAAQSPMARAQSLGLETIVLDHHTVEAHPPVFAHVNPNAPGDSSGLTQICAAGLVFLFLIAVQSLLRSHNWFSSRVIAEADLMAELDLVALATMADVVPLTGVNRAFVRQGLRRLDALERPGLRALARLGGATPPFSAYHLGFVFGPRINAGGRVGRCDLGARLLSCDDPIEAELLAAELDLHNRERQAIEAGILETAHAMADAEDHNSFLLLAGDGWHAGVVGIIAGRLKERHAKPALVVGFESPLEDAIGRGSARSVPGVDLGAIIRAGLAAGLLETGGGHAMAAGFSLRRGQCAGFADFLARHIDPQRRNIAAASELLADAVVSVSGADLDLLAELDQASPFGAGNPEPVVLMPDMLVAYAGIVGSNHVRLRLVGRDGKGLSAIAFRAADTALGRSLMHARGERIHAAGRLKRDDYDGTPKIQLQLEDAALAG
jgi:single-stranded-DNA-specific exonuclease